MFLVDHKLQAIAKKARIWIFFLNVFGNLLHIHHS